MKRVFLSLTVASLLLAGGRPGRACQYCQLAAAGDPEAARLAAQIHGEGFPLEGIINQYAPVAPAANLSAPPTVGSVATKPSDLPTTVIRRANLPGPPLAATGHARASAIQSISPAADPANSGRWTDAGLLGLVAAGGLFCWRTRRATAPVS